MYRVAKGFLQMAVFTALVGSAWLASRAYADDKDCTDRGGSFPPSCVSNPEPCLSGHCHQVGTTNACDC